MNDYQPTREDKFSFGLWTVGWQAQDVFGGPTRAPLDSDEAVHRLSDLGAVAVTFHDDDLFPFGSDDATRDKLIGRFKDVLSETCVAVEIITTDMSSPPIFKDGGFTSN